MWEEPEIGASSLVQEPPTTGPLSSDRKWKRWPGSGRRGRHVIAIRPFPIMLGSSLSGKWPRLGSILNIRFYNPNRLTTVWGIFVCDKAIIMCKLL